MKAVTTGGVEAMIKAVNKHINNAGVCEDGCGTLRNMTASNGKNWQNNKTTTQSKMNS